MFVYQSLNLNMRDDHWHLHHFFFFFMYALELGLIKIKIRSARKRKKEKIIASIHGPFTCFGSMLTVKHGNIYVYNVKRKFCL